MRLSCWTEKYNYVPQPFPALHAESQVTAALPYIPSLVLAWAVNGRKIHCFLKKLLWVHWRCLLCICMNVQGLTFKMATLVLVIYLHQETQVYEPRMSTLCRRHGGNSHLEKGKPKQRWGFGQRCNESERGGEVEEQGGKSWMTLQLLQTTSDTLGFYIAF